MLKVKQNITIISDFFQYCQQMDGHFKYCTNNDMIVNDTKNKFCVLVKLKKQKACSLSMHINIGVFGSIMRPVSLSDKIDSYRKISWSLEASGLVV